MRGINIAHMDVAFAEDLAGHVGKLFAQTFFEHLLQSRREVNSPMHVRIIVYMFEVPTIVRGHRLVKPPGVIPEPAAEPIFA
jgi:hypothetical protein